MFFFELLEAPRHPGAVSMFSWKFVFISSTFFYAAHGWCVGSDPNVDLVRGLLEATKLSGADNEAKGSLLDSILKDAMDRLQRCHDESFGVIDTANSAANSAAQQCMSDAHETRIQLLAACESSKSALQQVQI